MRIDIESLVHECRSALASDDCAGRIGEVLARATRERGALTAVLGNPARGGIRALHRSPELTVLDVVWSPGIEVMPHDHRMWAVIGIYAGREDNVFWRRVPQAGHGRIERAGTRTLVDGEVAVLAGDAIHSVSNPTAAFTGAIHVYGGDFFAVARSAWDPAELIEQPFDGEAARRLLEAATPAGQVTPAGDRRHAGDSGKTR